MFFLDYSLLEVLLDRNCVALLVVSAHNVLSCAQVGWETCIAAIALLQEAKVLFLRQTWREGVSLDQLLVELELRAEYLQLVYLLLHYNGVRLRR